MADLELSTAEAIGRLEEQDVPCGPVLPMEQVPTDPQVVANAILVESRHPPLGRIRQPPPPARFEATPSEIRRPAPAFGEHTDEVLGAAGLGAAEIADLRGKGIVG